MNNLELSDRVKTATEGQFYASLGPKLLHESAMVCKSTEVQRKKRPAYARQFKRQGLPIAFVFTGEPDCWQQAKQEWERGYINHLVLPDTSEPKDWSLLKGFDVILVHFNDEDPEALKSVVVQILRVGVKIVAVRDFYDHLGHVVTYNNLNEVCS